MKGILLLTNIVPISYDVINIYGLPFIIDIDKNTQISINIATDTKLALFSYINMKKLSRNTLPLSL